MSPRDTVDMSFFKDVPLPSLRSFSEDETDYMSSQSKHRSLQETAMPSSSPGVSEDIPTGIPTSAPILPPPPSTPNRTTGISVFIVLIVFTVSVFVTMRMVRNWRDKRDADYMQARSEAADRVLGDMQMVETGDLDSELI